MRYYQGGSVKLLDDISHCKGLAAARHAEQYLRTETVFDALNQLGYCLRLIPAG